MKVFISQPMNGKSDEEIIEEREKAVSEVKKSYGEDIEVLESFFKGIPHDASPLYYLGEAIKVMDQADIVFFCKDWEKYRGCCIEHECAEKYGKILMY